MNAFYTSPEVIDGIYRALEQFNFKSGRILEPSCGVGNFFGKMPEEMRNKSSLHGIELDSVSGRIAQKLYPNAEIGVKGFQDNDFGKNAFDVAVGNVPFGDIPIYHGNRKLNIHDYFFAETLDKVKPGGVIAFVTSTGTLDKQDESFRRELANRSDLIGAVRLPSNAFKANANTEVTSDIIFLRKKPENAPKLSESELPDWVGRDTVYTAENTAVKVNKYFVNHPDMVLGNIAEGNKLYGIGSGTSCKPFAETDTRHAPLRDLLNRAIEKMSAVISKAKPSPLRPERKPSDVEIPSDLRNFSYFAKDKKIYFKVDNFECREIDLAKKKMAVLHDFITLRDATRDIISAQKDNVSDEELRGYQEKLTAAYIHFKNRHGILHSSVKSDFADDVSAPLVLSLEAEYEVGKKRNDPGVLKREADIFTKRVIQPAKPLDKVDTALEALALSISEHGRVDLDYMKQLTDTEKNILIEELRGEIYLNPQTHLYETSAEYLSGDIRKKLRAAEEAVKSDDRFSANVKALSEAIPPTVKSGDIDIKLGATWVPPKYYEQFMYETFNTSNMRRSSGFSMVKKVELKRSGNEFYISNKREDSNALVDSSFGVKTKNGVVKKNGYEILENVLNMRETRVFKQSLIPGQNPQLDEEATKIAQNRAEKLREVWQKWVFKDTERRRQLTEIYNEKFNSVRPREYDGSALRFPEMSTGIKLKEHQKDAVAHAIFGGNTLFAHSVGAGKTYEMIAAAMESKRLGLHNKSLICVPNHLTEQIGNDFIKLYPNANILVATTEDFTEKNRKKLFAKIATGDFDAVIIGHSQLLKIPLNPEFQKRHIDEQVQDITWAINEAKKEKGNEFSVKQLEKAKVKLETKAKELAKQIGTHQDGVLYFDELGVDKLFVDEGYVNVFTKLSGRKTHKYQLFTCAFP